MASSLTTFQHQTSKYLESLYVEGHGLKTQYRKECKYIVHLVMATNTSQFMLKKKINDAHLTLQCRLYICDIPHMVYHMQMILEFYHFAVGHRILLLKTIEIL
jgi:hypothetical protein